MGNVLNGLSHFHRVRYRAQFAMCLIRGLGGNLTDTSREEFAKQVLSFIPIHDSTYHQLLYQSTDLTRLRSFPIILYKSSSKVTVTAI